MYCKNCGKLISDDSHFCSYCGTKLTSSETGGSIRFNEYISRIKSRCRHLINKLTGKSEQLLIPQGHMYCAYCGKVKHEDQFEKSLDVTYNRCKGCEQRESTIKWILVVLTLIALLAILIVCVEDQGIEGIFVVFGLLVSGIAIIPALVLYLLLDKILGYTSLRISLSKNRTDYLSQLKDVKGDFVITPIVRTVLEDIYKQKTGYYRSRDIPYNHYRCPICKEIHPISEDEHVVFDAEHKTSYKGTWMGTARITRTTNYKYRICQNCNKLTKIGDILYPVVGISSTIVTPIIFGVIKGFTLWGVLGMTLLGFVGGAIMGLIINLLYRLIVWLFTDKWLFVNYETAAYYGALMRLENGEIV